MMKIFVLFVFLFFFALPFNGNCDEVEEKILRIAVDPLLSPLFNKFAENFYHQISYTKIENKNSRTNLIQKLCSDGNGLSIFITYNKLNPSENSICLGKNIKIKEEKLGYYGFVFVGNKKREDDNMEFFRSHLYKALTKEFLLGSGKKNSYKKWSDVNKTLSDDLISIYGPFTESEEFQFLSDNFISKQCAANYYNQEKYEKFDELLKVCKEIRTDGVYIGDSLDSRLTVQKVSSDELNYGIVLYSVYKKYQDLLSLKSFDGVFPTRENILSGKYGLTVPIYIYYKDATTHKLTNDFLQEINSKNIKGEDGLLSDFGFIG